VVQEIMDHSHALTSDNLVKRSDGVIDAEIDNEIVVLSIAQSTCYGLNCVGSRIWNLLAKPNRIGDLCTTLLSEYEIDASVCERQVLDLLEELRAEGLIIMVDEK
jgi:hypothetical protein